MSAARFESPQDAEDAFYEAFEAHDLPAFMAVWDDAGDVAAVLPSGQVLLGREAIAATWEEMFRAPQRPDITIEHRHWLESGDLAVHLVEARLAFGAPGEAPPPMAATNVYRHTAGGWRMVLHQAAPPAAPPAPMPGPRLRQEPPAAP